MYINVEMNMVLNIAERNSQIFCKMKEGVSVACVFILYILCIKLRRAHSFTYNTYLFFIADLPINRPKAIVAFVLSKI